jgi:tetratricopeptide (TPR) repeat protein
MKTSKQLIIGLILLSLSMQNIYAVDHFSAQTNEFLVQKIDSFQYDKNNPEVWKYINAYILKARIREDNETLFYGYKEGIYYSNDYSNKLKYADSTIIAAQNTQKNDFLIQSYLSKGMIHFQFKKFQPALENYLIAEKKLNHKSSEYLSYKVIFNLALIKFHLKLFSESDVLFQKCSSYFEKNSSDINHQVYYLNTLYYRAQILQTQRKFKLANQLNQQGLRLSQKAENAYFTHYFSFSKAIDDYYNNDYQQVIHSLSKELNYLEKQNDFNTLTKAYFYIGKSFEKLDNF